VEFSKVVASSLKKGNVSFIVHIPDKILLPLVNLLSKDDFFKCTLVTREEEGVGVAAGAYLGGKRTALMMQSTGLGNSLNALTSLDIAHQIPLLMIIALRGSLFEYNPADVRLGLSFERVLDAVGIPCFSPTNPDQLGLTLDGAITLTETSKSPVAVVLNPVLLQS
jgi:sulfopyruvate decarboxylase subunit alpha